MKHKAAPALVKESGELGGGVTPGEFEAIVSVFGNVDTVGDMVMPGAFSESLAKWKRGPDHMPVLWSHRMDDPLYNIGSVMEAEELAAGDPRIPDWADEHVKEHGGLWVKGVIDTGDDASPIARQAAHLLRNRRVTQFSFAYDVDEQKFDAKSGVNHLQRLSIFEVSPTQIGANQLTELVGAKAQCQCGGAAPPATQEAETKSGQADEPPTQPSAAIRAQCIAIEAALMEHEIDNPGLSEQIGR